MFLRKVLEKNGIYFPLYYLIVAWFLNYFLGFISFVYDPNSVLARDAGAAFTLPLMICLLWWGKRMCLTVGAKNLAFVASHRHRRNNQRLFILFMHIMQRKIRRLQPYLILTATAISFTYLYSEALFIVSDSSSSPSQYRFILLLQALPFWICILNFIAVLLIIYRLTNIYLTKYWKVRLFEIEIMGPICNMVVVNFLVSALLISVYPINALFVTLPETDRIALLFFSFFSASLLLYPILLVQRAFKKRKEQTLVRINSALNQQIEHPASETDCRRLVDDDIRLQFVADLLVVRKEVHRAPMWPMDLPFTIKMSVILMLPMASWVGAGIISQIIKPWIQ
jgi:hypothetical protein